MTAGPRLMVGVAMVTMVAAGGSPAASSDPLAFLTALGIMNAGEESKVAAHRFSNPPRIEDLADLNLDDQDLRDLRKCRPGNCDVKLTVSEIASIREAAVAAGPRVDQCTAPGVVPLAEEV